MDTTPEWDDLRPQLDKLKQQYVAGELSDVEYFLAVDEIGVESFVGIINWPRAFETPARGRETESSFPDRVERQRLGVYTTGMKKPCAFCNADELVVDRGTVTQATRKLIATEGPNKGMPVGWSCELCLSGCFVTNR